MKRRALYAHYTNPRIQTLHGRLIIGDVYVYREGGRDILVQLKEDRSDESGVRILLTVIDNSAANHQFQAFASNDPNIGCTWTLHNAHIPAKAISKRKVDE